MAIRRSGVFVDNVIFRPVTSGDCSGQDDERKQNQDGCVSGTHDRESTGFVRSFKKEFCVSNTSADATCDELVVNKPFTL